jgi:hypothetical protein
MKIIDGATEKIQVVTGSAADVEVHVSYVDNNAGTITPAGDVPTNITTATTTDIVPAPGASIQRNVGEISLFNNHGSTSTTITVQVTDGTDTAVLWKGTLAAGEAVVFDETGRWIAYDNLGLAKLSSYPIASQADQEAGTSLVAAVTPGRQHYHPSAVKFWADVVGTGLSINASYNVTSVTDTGAGLLTVNIDVDFSSVNYCAGVAIERASTALTVTNVQDGAIRNAGQAAGTLLVESYDHTATTMVQEDPTSYYVWGMGDL